MSACSICAHADEHGWWGPDLREQGAETHCRDCHRSWSGTTQAHCVVCHRHFTTDSAAAQHVKPGDGVYCYSDSHMKRRRRLAVRGSKHGPIWPWAGSPTNPYS